MKLPIPAIWVAISIAIIISQLKSYASLRPLNMEGEMAGSTIFVNVEQRPDLKMVVTWNSSGGMFFVPSLTVKKIGKNPTMDAIIMAAVLPGPTHSTKSGRNERSGSAPNSITNGVRVKSNLFLLPATKAIGNANEKANTIPQMRFRKL